MEFEERIEAKLNALAQTIGGPALKEAWAEAEEGLPKRQQTFKRARCGCFRGSPHQPGCEKHVAHDPLGSIA